MAAQVLPIYTQDDQDDILIRAYTKCPAYQAALEAWFRSSEFADKSAESASLRAQVQASMPRVNTSLANWCGGDLPGVSPAGYFRFPPPAPVAPTLTPQQRHAQSECRHKAPHLLALFVRKHTSTLALNPPVALRWNVYDSINVYQTYGVGDPVPAFNASQFGQVGRRSGTRP